MISLHNSNSALQDGDIKFLYSNDKTEVFAFERSDNNEKIISVFNTGRDKQNFDIKVDIKNFTWKELLSGEVGNLFMEIIL